MTDKHLAHCWVCQAPLNTDDPKKVCVLPSGRMVCRECWEFYVEPLYPVAGGQGRGADEVLSQGRFLLWCSVGCFVWLAIWYALKLWNW